MNEQKLEKQRRNLVDRGVLSPDEKLYGSITINYTEKLVGRIETWKQGGVAIFTDRQVILTKGFSCEYIHIPYICIKELGKCNQGFFPIGMVITYENRESGEIVTEKISLEKRNGCRFYRRKQDYSFPVERREYGYGRINSSVC